MKLRTRLGLGAVAGLLVLGLTPAGAGYAAAEHADRSGKPESKYLYSVSFVGEVTYDLRNELGADYDTATALATVRGTLPNVVVGSSDGTSLTARGTKGSVRVDGAAASSIGTQDDRRFVQNCSGDTAKVQGPPYVGPSLLGEDPQVALFTRLEFPLACTDNEGGAGAGAIVLAQNTVEVTGVRNGQVGDRSYSLRVFGDVEGPAGATPDRSQCLGYVAEWTVRCDYQIEGTLTLKLVKRLDPEKTAPTSASVSPSRARAKVVCASRCTVDIKVVPLKGGPTIAVDRVTPKPGKPVGVTIPIPPKKRGLVTQAGGVRMTLTYTFARGVRITQVRTARL